MNAQPVTKTQFIHLCDSDLKSLDEHTIDQLNSLVSDLQTFSKADAECLKNLQKARDNLALVRWTFAFAIVLAISLAVAAALTSDPTLLIIFSVLATVSAGTAGALCRWPMNMVQIELQ